MIKPLTPPELNAYFVRIGFGGEPRADLATLTVLQAAHLAAIPFEAIDTQLGTPPGLDPDTIFAKLVTARRGGWCYEMNGLLGRVLVTIGFKVTRLAGGVMRQVLGDFVLGGHLCLRVDLDQPYLVDCGFGGALLAPIPLRKGEHSFPPFTVSLTRTEDGFWRFTQQGHGAPFSFDFRDEPADEALLADRCAWQGTHAESNFTQNLVAHRRAGARHVTLRGRVIETSTPAGTERRVLASPDELVLALRTEMDLDVPQVAGLWDRVCARHEELFGG